MSNPLKKRPSEDDVSVFTQELSWMLQAGVSLGQALGILVSDVGTRPMRSILEAIHTDLKSGVTFSEALNKHRTVFPEAYILLISLAEGTGTLPMILQRLYASRQRSKAIKRRIVSALLYPGFLILASLLAMSAIIIVVIPKLRTVLPDEPKPDGSDSALRSLMAISDWILSNLTLMAVLSAGLVSFAGVVVRSDFTKRLLLISLPKLPGIGNVIVIAQLSEMTHSLAMLTGAGLKLSDAVALTKRSTVSPHLSDVLQKMEDAIRAGEDITQPLRSSRLIPPLLPSLLTVGQEIGDIHKSMEQAALILEEKHRVHVERTLVLLEPVIIGLIAICVGSLVYSVMSALLVVNDLFI